MLEISGHGLTLEAFARVTEGGATVTLAVAARERVERGRCAIEEILGRDEPVYGVNTGFGLLASRRIPEEQLAELQRRLLLSHAAGVGRPLRPATVRGMLLLRANALAQGHSGVRPEVIDRLLELLNLDLLPVVPSRGSVGASGDLAPLAHLALPLIGMGSVSAARVAGAGGLSAGAGREEQPAAEALGKAGLEPLTLEAKEGLALINGTQAMTTLLALGALSARRQTKIADLIGALSTDAIRGTDSGFDPRVHRLRPHPGQEASARNLWALFQGSAIRESHRVDDPRVQDPYSFRCMPQVHGAVRDVLADVVRKLDIEMNSVTDNPLVFPDQDGEAQVISGGNFHGEPMALAADFLSIAVAELGSISERRIEQLTDPKFSDLPAFLVENSGLNSGFMIAHVAAAALASENKTLCYPASVDSIPTSAGQEDHVSMGMGAALKLGRVLDNTLQILAIELLAACQGIEFRRPLKTSPALEKVYRDVRATIPPWTENRVMADDLKAALEFLRSGVEPHLERLS
ncbi:MAG: histidine ammonia-lyase [Acidobacteria bacterium]|nr:histidine ammonia-lyase [Acidobacteriota bacterium]